MTKRTDDWEALLDNPRVMNWPWSPMAGKTPLGRLLTERHEAITEVVRLRRALVELQVLYVKAHYWDGDEWEKGKSHAYRRVLRDLTRTLEGENNG